MAETDPKTVQDLTSVVRTTVRSRGRDIPGRRQQGPRIQALSPRRAGSLEAVFLEASPAEASGQLDSPGLWV